MTDFSSMEMILLRERLILYFNENYGTEASPKTVRTLLTDLMYSEFTSFDFDDNELIDDEQYDHYFPLKDDTLGRFLTRRQSKIDNSNALEVFKFLCGAKYVSDVELKTLRSTLNREQPLTFNNKYKNVLDLIPSPGEYASRQDTDVLLHKSIILCSKMDKSSCVKTYRKSVDYIKYDFESLAAFRQKIRAKNYDKSHLCIGNFISRDSEGVILIEFNSKHELITSHLEYLNNNKNVFCLCGSINGEFKNIESIFKPIFNSFINIISDIIGIDAIIDEFKKKDKTTNYRKINNNIESANISIFSWRLEDVIFGFGGNLKKEYNDLGINDELINAAKHNDVYRVLQALLEGADVNYRSPDNGFTVAHWAASNNSEEIYNLLSPIGHFRFLNDQERRAEIESGMSPNFTASEKKITLDYLMSIPDKVAIHINDRQKVFESQIEGLKKSTFPCFLGQFGDMEDIINNWLQAISKLDPIVKNNDGNFPSACIPNSEISFSNYKDSFHHRVLQTESYACGRKGKNFFQLAGSDPFSNCMR